MAEQANDDEKISEAVQKIIDACNKECLVEVKKKMKEAFPKYDDEKIDEYANNVLTWDNEFDSYEIDPGDVVSSWIEIILAITAFKKELKKKEKKDGKKMDADKKAEKIKKRLKKSCKEQFKKDYSKMAEDAVTEITNKVFKWHTEVLGSDVKQFVKTWVEVESDKLQPIRQKYEKQRDKQEDIEHAKEVKEAAAKHQKEEAERRKKWESEKEERKLEREKQKKEEEEKRKKAEEKARKEAEYEKKPKFYKSPRKLSGKTYNAKDSAKLKEYLTKQKGTQFVIMYEKQDGKKLMEYLRPNFIEKYGTKYHFITCKMDNDLGKAAKIWFNAWDGYTMNQYPCFAIFLNGRGTNEEHIFFTNFENGKEKLEALFADAVHLKYDKKVCF